MRLINLIITASFLAIILGSLGAMAIYQHYSQDLPDYNALKNYQPPVLSRIYADDGHMLATFAEEQRVFMPVGSIPKQVINAFLSAEDQDFYQHGGVDYLGIVRAAFINLQNVGRDHRPMGASTITQQVAKNILLTNEVSITRKIREAIVATRMEKALSKDRILEIYLNEIFLGNRSYGIAAAALNYFNKSLNELTIGEAAYLAALAKGPSLYHPVRNYQGAISRRNWVIERMQINGFISRTEAEDAQKLPLVVRTRGNDAVVDAADYFSEEVRRQLVSQYGDDRVLQGGLAVKTSLDPEFQTVATKALRDGLIAFDRRERGWRGAVTRLPNMIEWPKQLRAIPMPPGGTGWKMAAVIGLKETGAEIGFSDQTHGQIPWPEMKWARRELKGNSFGPPIKKPADVLSIGDVILVEAVKASEDNKPYPAASYTLRQIPLVQGAIVAMDPHTGRVRAMTGGFSAEISQFNRVTQAARQPGSAFKPFVYMAALDKGFTPSSLILDAPFEYFQGPGLPLWRPENYSQEFYGPSTLRVGIEKSRNVMTVRLANAIGMPAVVSYAKKFGVVDDMPELLSYSLGAKETTPIRMAAAYSAIVNGGKKVTPSLIDRVMDNNGKTLWKTDQRACEKCSDIVWSDKLTIPNIPDDRQQIEDPRTAYQMTSILEGVVQRGTAAKLISLGFPVAGKTGTTNDSKDAWFVGFTPDLVCAVYVGFDDPKPLGSHETGASVAVPIFKTFMAEANKNKDPIPFRVPPGLRMVRVNPETGALSEPGDKQSIWEAFLPGTEPQEDSPRPILDGSVTGSASAGVNNAQMVSPEMHSEEPHSEGQGNTSSPASESDHRQDTNTTPPSTTGTGGLY